MELLVRHLCQQIADDRNDFLVDRKQLGRDAIAIAEGRYAGDHHQPGPAGGPTANNTKMTTNDGGLGPPAITARRESGRMLG